MSWPTTRRYPRSLREAYQKDYADAIERPDGISRVTDWIVFCIAAGLLTAIAWGWL